MMIRGSVKWAFGRVVALVGGLAVVALIAGFRSAGTKSILRHFSGDSVASFRLIKSEFIVAEPPVASSHASTIVETPTGLAAAWFGGSREGAADTGIWFSRFDGRTWASPQEIAVGVMPGDPRRYPCWNPVLFLRRSGELLLFYKIGPSPATWWGMVKASRDNGLTWEEAHRLPEGIIGPVKNKPLEIGDGTLLCGSSTENEGWRVHMEWTYDPFGAWERSPALNDAPAVSAIQPVILKYPGGRLQILCRSKQGVLFESLAPTGNSTSWPKLTPTAVPNPDSGIDGTVLSDGRAILVYNPTRKGRGILAVASSRDGKDWAPVFELENEPAGEYSYPAVIQTRDGLVHVTYTWRREKIRHVVLDPGQS